jgi:hypothetical protein
MDEPQTGSGSTLLRNIMLGVAGIYIVVSLVFMLGLNRRLAVLEQKQVQTEEKLAQKIEHNQAAAQTLAAELDQTQEQLATRSAELQRQQKAAESRLKTEQQKSEAKLGEKLGEISTGLGGVAQEVGTVRTDLGSTRSDLEATKAKLERAIGDLGLQSGLIARTRDDLDALKRKGDRNIYEFLLAKGKPMPLSTISLQLKKSDAKKNKFTVNVIADDKTIEKKDRTVAEPLQFYTGKEGSRQLYELVVMSVEKNQVRGYLSTPLK